MAEHPNTQTVRDAYTAFLAGDLPTALAAMEPDVVFHVGGDGPLSGEHKGREAVGEALVKSALATGGSQRFDIRGIFADDAHAVVVTRETATRVADGATLDVEEVHLIAFGPNGLVADLWDIPADPDAHDAFFDGR